MTNKTLDSWDSFCGSNFLKASDVLSENDAFVVVNAEIFEDEDKTSKPRLKLQKNQTDFIFDLNVTNANFCKNAGISNPRNLIGKKIYFRKVFVPSPKTKKEVESLRICKIE
jgi:hypothetical protein